MALSAYSWLQVWMHTRWMHGQGEHIVDRDAVILHLYMEAFTHSTFRFGLLRDDGHDCDCHGHGCCCRIVQGSRHDEAKPESPSHSALPTLRICDHATSSSLTLLELRVLQPWFRPHASLPRTVHPGSRAFLQISRRVCLTTIATLSAPTFYQHGFAKLLLHTSAW